MDDTTTWAARFGQLRSLLHARAADDPEAEDARADEVHDLIEQAWQDDPTRYEAQWRPYLDAHHEAMPTLVFPRLSDLDEAHRTYLPARCGLGLLDSRGLDGRLDALLDGPLAPRLRALALSCLALREEDVRRLATTPALQGLHTLCLAHNPLSPALVDALARSPHLAGLRALEVEFCGLDAAAIPALLGPNTLWQLDALMLDGNPLGEEGVRALGRAPGLARLRKLGLENIKIGRWGMDELFGALLASPLPALRELSLAHVWSGHYLRDNRWPELLRSRAPALESLDLSGNSLIPPVIKALVANLPPTLRTLWLHNTSLRGDGARLFLAHMQTGLHTLSLSGCELWSSATVLSEPWPALDAPPTLRALDLGYNRLDDETLAGLVACPHLGALESLELCHNALTDAGAQALVRSPHLGALRHLSVSYNDQMTARGVRALMEGLRLETLTVAGIVDDAEAEALMATSGVKLLT